MKSIALIITLLLNNGTLKKDSVTHFFQDNLSSGSIVEIMTGSIFKENDFDKNIYSHLNMKRFDSTMFFTRFHFSGSVNFCASEFDNDVIFGSAEFDSLIDFSGATFKKDIDFSNCRFHKFLFLSGIYTDSLTSFNFYNASLPALIDFSHNATLHKVVDFTNADFDSVLITKTFSKDTRYFINIYNTDISKIKIGYQNFRMCFYDPQQKDKMLAKYLYTLKKKYGNRYIFNNRAMYNEFIASPIYKEYISQIFPSTSIRDTVIENYTHFYFNITKFPSRLSKDQVDALYSRLLKNFEINGQLDSYKLLDIDYQDYRWSTEPSIIRWLYIFPKYWNFYGNETECILGWTPLLLLILTLLTFFFYDHVFSEANKNKVTYHLKNIPQINSTKWPHYQKFRNSLIFTSVIFFSFNLKTDKLDFKNPSFFYIVTINILGLLCLAYLANYVLQR